MHVFKTLYIAGFLADRTCDCLKFVFSCVIFFLILDNSIEVKPWCDGKCLPPNAVGCGFEFGNQPLQ